MKKLLVAILALFTLFAFTGCGDNAAVTPPPSDEGTQIVVTVGTESFNATLAENETAKAFKQMLPITLDMSELNGNEKYNYLSKNLPSNSSPAETIHEGDIMLYGSNCVVLFYETFSSSYSYTRIGWIDDVSGLKAALGSGDVTVTFSVATTSDDGEQKVLVAYFSCTNTTKGVAEEIHIQVTHSYLYEIVPQVPYTEDDLKYYTDCRADREQADSAARPAISGSVEDIGQYDVIFIGYPIWHGQAPKIIYTFLESYDFSGKTIIPFCTSASSPMGSSATNLHSLAPEANWKSGARISGNNVSSLIAQMN